MYIHIYTYVQSITNKRVIVIRKEIEKRELQKKGGDIVSNREKGAIAIEKRKQ